MLNVFTGSAFDSLSLTAAMNKLPYKPGRLGAMGLFRRIGITKTVALIEEQHGKLSLIPDKPRGVQTTLNTRASREARPFKANHLPVNDQILADDVQGIRAFGSEDATETIADVVNEMLATMRQSLEVTVEYHRIGAIRGIVLDADGSTVLRNLFTEFSITENTVNFDFTAGAQDMKTKSTEVIRVVEEALGATPYDHIHAICGNDFWDSFIAHESVVRAFERHQENSFARTQQRSGFAFSDIIWENYRGKVGTVDFIPADTCRFFPVGVPDLFLEHYAPANFIETVNTVGKPVYAKQEPLPMGTGIAMHSQSNPLLICTRPGALVKGS